MFRTLTIGKKIGIGFAVMLTMIVFVGAGGYLAMRHMMRAIVLNEEISVIQQNFSDAASHVNLYLLNNYGEAREIQNSEKEQAAQYLRSALESIRNIDPELGRMVRDALEAIKREISAYVLIFKKHTDSEAAKIRIEDQIRSDHAAIAGDIQKAGFLTDEMQMYNELVFSACVSYIARNAEPRWIKTEGSIGNLRKAIEDWYYKIEKSDMLRQIGQNIQSRFETYEKNIRQYHEESLRQKEYETRMLSHIKTLYTLFAELGSITSENMGHFRMTSIAILFGFMTVSLLAGGCYAVLSTRSITSPIKYLTEIAEKVSQGNLDIRTDIHTGDETKILGTAFNRMLDRIQSQITAVAEAVEQRMAAESEVKLLAYDMELAKKIQTVLLPKKPEISGYEIAASCEPADEVGGDYYDVISVGAFDWIVIGDVSGHGVTSGLVMMMVQTSIHTVLIQNPETPPSRLLSVINRTIYENIVRMDEQKHMTIVVIACGKDGFFDFSGLHEDILLWCDDTRKVEKIETDGMWIGLEPDISHLLPAQKFRMEKGDCLVLYSDGITEAWGKDGKMFGTERLIEVIEKFGDRSASEIHAAILDALSPYEKSDDVTLLVMKRK